MGSAGSHLARDLAAAPQADQSRVLELTTKLESAEGTIRMLNARVDGGVKPTTLFR